MNYDIPLDERTTTIYIIKFIQNFEKDNDVNVLYAVESGSRAHGTEVDDSDFDLKGFFLPNPRDCLRVIPKIPSVLKIPRNSMTIGTQEYEVDVDFIDLRAFAIEKVRDGSCNYDFCLFSPAVYVNKYPWIIQSITQKLKPSSSEFFGKLQSLHNFCLKSLSKSHECLNKKILASLVNGVQYFHVRVFNSFPFCKVWSEISFLKNQLDKLVDDGTITEGDKSILIEIFNLIEYYYSEKKKGRKSVSNVLSEYQYKFLDLLQSKFPQIENENEDISIEFFQNLCNEVFYI